MILALEEKIPVIKENEVAEASMDLAQTQAITLHLLGQENIDLVEHLWRDPLVRRYLGGPQDIVSIHDSFQTMLEANAHWLMAPGDRESSKNQQDLYLVVKVGASSAGVVSIDAYHTPGDYQLSYQFLPTYWGQGIAQPALLQLLTRARQLGFDQLYAETQSQNIASCRRLEKLGFKLTRQLERFGATQSVYLWTAASAFQPIVISDHRDFRQDNAAVSL